VAYIVGEPEDRRVAVGKVLEVFLPRKQVELHVFRALWAGVRVIWRPLLEARGGDLTLDPAVGRDAIR